MSRILKERKSVIAAVLALIILTIVRIQVLKDGIDYENSLYAIGKEAINIIYYVLLAVSGAGIVTAAFFDIRGKERIAPDGFAPKYAYIIGIIMIIGGAGAAPTVISGLSTGMKLYHISALIFLISCIVSGMIMFRSGKIHLAHCIAVMGIVASYLLRAIIYFIEHPLIAKSPQQLMVILFYISSALFWINAGRLISGGEKALSRTAAICFGLFSSASSLAYIISSLAFVLIDSEKWLKLTETPDIEIIITAFLPAAIAITLLCAKKGETADTLPSSDEAEETTETITTEE